MGIPAPRPPHKDGARSTELDALRGFAALSVVLFHFTSRYDAVYGHTGPIALAFPSGHFGVQFFFALSGFVIFMTLGRTAVPLDFIVSRVSRLYPAYWAAILLTTLIVVVADARDFWQPTWVVLTNLTMIQGLFHVPSVDGVYWTLLVELCFYFGMFVIYLCRQLPRIEPILFAWIGLKWMWWLFPNLSYTAGLILTQEHIPFFAIGISAFRIYSGVQTPRRVAPLVAFALLTILALDGVATFIVGLLVTVTFLGIARGYLTWLGAPVFVWLGGISYTLYLLHENIGWTVIGRLEGAGIPANLAILAAIATSLGLAALVTYLVERPAMRYIRGLYRARAPRPGAAPRVILHLEPGIPPGGGASGP